ncbi:MAG: nucleotide exchange factor GrpE [bacterium]|nr:nucleotide exchange factor GrpE [bacterium]
MNPEPATNGGSEPVTPDDLTRCRAERDEYLDGWKRAKADLVNHKREEAERLERFAKFSTEDLVRDLLSVVDSFDLGVQAVKDDAGALQGMVLVRSQLESVLARRGLERLTVPPGTPFDPARHEAVGEAAGPPTGGDPPGTVAEEVSAGFLFHGNVLRPARVMLVGDRQPASPELQPSLDSTSRRGGRGEQTTDDPQRTADN